MTETSNRARVPAGARTGGQFATEPKTETMVALTFAPDVRRADDLIALYRSITGRTEASFADSAREALADLLAWTDAEGVYVTDLVPTAR